jgi:diaminohydroxyphosphoribosylaminopyrimidine deaminase / 5-amino-6-(5-phosphoribosylamino)uracil reductase
MRIPIRTRRRRRERGIREALMDFMARALELARAQTCRTSPNPWVGAVVVKNGQVVGEGATEPPPGRHAEVVALEAAGSNAEGADLYVTLEPCSFEGRTGACTRAIKDAAIKRVICAMIDLDPRALGRGLMILKPRGVEVELDADHAAEAEALLEPYSHQRRTGRPFVTAKFAMSLDGKIAATSGDSRWVSSEESRAAAHDLRTRIDAILVGSETIVVDNPELTARPGGRLASYQPLRVVLDSRGRVQGTARIFDGPGRPLVISTGASDPSWRAEVAMVGDVELAAAGPDGRVSPASALEILGRRGVLHLLLEGGGAIHGSFLDAALVDKVYAVIAPLIIGGTGRDAVGGQGATVMAEAWHLDRLEVSQLGPDILVQGYPTRTA